LRKIGQGILPSVLYGAKKMNMISTGAFHSEMNASNEQETLVSKLVSAWEKKNSKTAKAGGVSLMALSLAACGSSDSDEVSFTQAQLDSAKAAATAAAEATAATAATAAAAAAATAQAAAVAAVDTTADDAAAILAAVQAVDAAATSVADVKTNATAAATPATSSGQVYALGSTADVIGPNSATAATKSTNGPDTFRAATNGDLSSSDIVDGGDGADLLTAVVTDASAAQTLKPMLTNVETVKLTAANSATASDDGVVTLDFGDSTGVTSVELVLANDHDNTITGLTTSMAATVTGVGTADSVVILTVGGLSTATDGGQDAYTVNLNKTDAASISLAGIEEVTLNLSGTAVDIDSLIATSIEKLTITGGVLDASVTNEAAVIGTSGSSASDAIDFAGLDTGETGVVDASGSTNSVTVIVDDSVDFSATGGAGKLTIDNTSAGASAAAGLAAATITAGAGGIAATIEGGGNAAGDTAMSLVNITGGAVADTVNIAGVVNPTDITATAADESLTVNATVTTGAGNDTVTIDAGVVDVKTGDGDDELVVTTTGNITGATGAAKDLIDLGGGTDTISTADATINASDTTWVGYISNPEDIKVTATAEKTVDLDLLADADITALFATAHTATAAAAAADVGGAGATGTGSSGGDALDFTGGNSNSTITISAALVGQAGQGCSAAANDAGDTGGAGGVGLDLNVTVDNGNNVATITLVDNADLTGGAGGEGSDANSTGGVGGIGLDANQVDELNIVLSATDTTADAVVIAGGAAGTAGSGTIGTVGGDISVAANGKITITESISGTATSTTISSINLNNIVGTNVTVEASTLTGAITIDSTVGNTSINLGGGADVFGGAENGIDTVSLGGGDDTVNHTGGAVDVFTGGAGIDTYKVAAAFDTSVDAFTVTDFARGSGGDVISIDVSTVDGGTAALVDNLDISGGLYVEGSVGTVTANDSAIAFASNSINVLTGSGFATYAAAETELALEAGAALTDIAVVIFNTTSGKGEMYLSDTTANATYDYKFCTFNDITSVGQLADFAAANFSEF
jgi:hypothetical protein